MVAYGPDVTTDAPGKGTSRTIGCILAAVIFFVVLALILLFTRSVWWKEGPAPGGGGIESLYVPHEPHPARPV